jgi:Zn-dependent protease
MDESSSVASPAAERGHLELDFLRRPSANRPLRCNFCKKPILGSYYDLGDQVGCDPCFRRDFLLDFDRIGGAIGGGCWAFILASLVVGIFSRNHLDSVFATALIVGLAVGWGVKSGSKARGGWLFQTIAIALVYLFLNLSEFDAVALFKPVVEMLPGLAGYENCLLFVLCGIGFVHAWKENRNLAVERNRYFFDSSDRKRPPSHPLPSSCSHCSIELAPRFLACPSCKKFVHSDQLKTLNSSATTALEEGRLLDARENLRAMLDLLPDSPTANEISKKVEGLNREIEESGIEKSFQVTPTVVLATVGTLGLLAWKLKSSLFLAATNLKALVVGLKSGTTIFSMLASALLLASHWNWKLAFGLMVLVYVHEIGHVVALKKLGIPATPPMFVPGLGAFVRLKQYPSSVRENARVGLAGPIWGATAAAFLFLGFLVYPSPILGNLVRFSAWINLFNLLPIGPLDGGRGFSALAKKERGIITAVLIVTWLVTGQFLLLLVAAVSFSRLFLAPGLRESDRRTFWSFIGLVISLGMLGAIDVPISDGRSELEDGQSTISPL